MGTGIGPAQERYVECRNGHQFTTRARGGTSVSCPECKRETGRRIAVWVPVNTKSPPAPRVDGDAIAVLLRIEAHLAALLGKVPDFADAPAEPAGPEVWARQREEWACLREREERERVEQEREQLLGDGQDGEVVVTVDQVAVRLRLSWNGARDRLRLLESYGFAQRAEDDLGPGRAHRWRIHGQEAREQQAYDALAEAPEAPGPGPGVVAVLGELLDRLARA
jgi:hypothetical protein